MVFIPNYFKMSRFKNILTLFMALATLIIFNACSGPHGDHPGLEYMPDMGHSVAYEANVYNYYYLNTWDSASVKTLKELSMPRNPVNGTIPRGYAGAASKGNSTSISVPVNGSVPYYYGNTDAERARAMAEIIDNPFPITDAGLAKTKDLYNIYCGICHGDKGDGNGWLVDEANLQAKYPAAPANFLQDTFYNSSNGRYYHAIMHGKGKMGGYADKLSYEERWQVIHYIHALQAKERKLVYNETENTMTSNSADVPGSTYCTNERCMEIMLGDGGETHGSEAHDGGDHDPARHGEDGHSHDGDGH